MSKPNGDDEIITINVGGRHFTTFKVLKFFIQKFLLQSSQIFFFQSTLLRFSHSILARMISGSIPMRKDREGRIFLDRDPNIFSFVLEYLRSSKVRV